ncbi:hypothetical protein CCACVL1_05771 [Corchorus capsularis]|uniref:Leucine-rich repeat-containing N-terminal plant-type domain-containing protein n=1 Tax=Corchorus capsularis TaxID=210143 RepID=A0A1R3JJ65_COCAP|nr:hypothetical protein CCACVL1_05771 [Corchorus capsularis]
MEGNKFKHSLHFVLFFTLLLFSLLSSTIIAADDDSAAMAMLLETIVTTPSNWSKNSFYCQWQGVMCDTNSSRVTAIFLKSNNLTSLPPKFPSLPNLDTLDLSVNSLSGSLPSLANLTSLKNLYLEHNNFNNIPQSFFTDLATTLQLLTLSDNPFPSWTIPTQLTRFPSFQVFFCDKANLTGQIPEIFHSFPLETLSLAQNNLFGPLPNSFRSSTIQKMSLHSQMLSGPIEVLSTMNLIGVQIYGNNFTGPIPDFSNSKSLIELRLDDNSLTGVVPSISLASLSSLRTVNLTGNKLQGPFPISLQENSLITADFDSNNFCTNSGNSCDPQVTSLLEIAAGFGYPLELSDAWTGNDACRNWRFIICDSKNNRSIIGIDFQKNNFGGTISPAFANLSELQYIYLNGNNLTGPIPDSLTKLAQLKHLDVSNNNLSGNIQQFNPSVTLNISGNPLLLTGKHDSIVTKISTLIADDDDSAAMAMLLETIVPTPNWSKNSSYCQWQGVICDSNSNRVTGIFLKSNNLTFLPPKFPSLPNLDTLDLSGNSLSGSLPSLANLTSLRDLFLEPDFDSNNFCTNSGNSCDPQVKSLLEIAAGFGYPLELSDAWTGNDACRNWRFVKCDSKNSIISIDFRMQHFGGTISPAFANLSELQYVYLNVNNLTGPIPDSLTKLAQLKLLDVSNNNLSGNIPQFNPSVTLNISGNPLLLTGKHGPETMEANKFKLSLKFVLFFILLLFSLLSTTIIAADDDSAAMAMLLETIVPTPSNWEEEQNWGRPFEQKQYRGGGL